MKRELQLKSTDKESRTMALPIGKSCKDCASFKRCKTLIGIKPDNEVCDFYPNEFSPIPQVDKPVNPYKYCCEERAWREGFDACLEWLNNYPEPVKQDRNERRKESE